MSSVAYAIEGVNVGGGTNPEHREYTFDGSFTYLQLARGVVLWRTEREPARSVRKYAERERERESRLNCFKFDKFKFNSATKRPGGTWKINYLFLPNSRQSQSPANVCRQRRERAGARGVSPYTITQSLTSMLWKAQLSARFE